MKKFLKILLCFLLVSVASFTLVGCNKPNETFKIETTQNNLKYGYTLGQGSYSKGEWVLIAAIPVKGYKFVSWSDGSNENPRDVLVDKDTTYKANFDVQTSLNSGVFRLDNLGIYLENVDSGIQTLKLGKLKVYTNYPNGNTVNKDDCFIGGFNTTNSTNYVDMGFYLYNLNQNLNNPYMYDNLNPSLIYTAQNQANTFNNNSSKKVRLEFIFTATFNDGTSPHIQGSVTIDLNLSLTNQNQKFSQQISMYPNNASKSYNYTLNIIPKFIEL